MPHYKVDEVAYPDEDNYVGGETFHPDLPHVYYDEDTADGDLADCVVDWVIRNSVTCPVPVDDADVFSEVYYNDDEITIDFYWHHVNESTDQVYTGCACVFLTKIPE